MTNCTVLCLYHFLATFEQRTDILPATRLLLTSRDLLERCLKLWRTTSEAETVCRRTPGSVTYKILSALTSHTAACLTKLRCYATIVFLSFSIILRQPTRLFIQDFIRGEWIQEGVVHPLLMMLSLLFPFLPLSPVLFFPSSSLIFSVPHLLSLSPFVPSQTS